MIAGAGHASNLDNPEEFTAVLQAFLNRATPPLKLVDGSVSIVTHVGQPPQGSWPHAGVRRRLSRGRA